MPRTALTVVNPVSINGGTPTATTADVAFAALDASNGNSLASTGRELLLFQNTDGASARTVTITSVADELGRLGNITAYSIGVGLFSLFGPFPQRGWRQSDGTLWIDGSHANLKVLPIKIPNTI